MDLPYMWSGKVEIDRQAYEEEMRTVIANTKRASRSTCVPALESGSRGMH